MRGFRDRPRWRVRVPGGAQQLVDFPLTDGMPIADLICTLFGEHPSGFVWLRMLEWEKLAGGWTYTLAEGGK